MTVAIAPGEAHALCSENGAGESTLIKVLAGSCVPDAGEVRVSGALTVRVAEALAAGKLKPGAATFDAGPLGQKQIAGDNVLLGQILVFNKENTDQYPF